MKIGIIENIIDLTDFLKFAVKACNGNKEQIDSRLDALCIEYAMNHDCKVQKVEDVNIFFPAELESIEWAAPMNYH